MVSRDPARAQNRRAGANPTATCKDQPVDTALYDIRRDLSRSLAQLREAQQTYPDDPTLHAIDDLQSAVERLTDLVEEMHLALFAHTEPRVATPQVPITGHTPRPAR